jgi:hypothetical protein
MHHRLKSKNRQDQKGKIVVRRDVYVLARPAGIFPALAVGINRLAHGRPDKGFSGSI